jgi:hypothetical protein
MRATVPWYELTVYATAAIALLSTSIYWMMAEHRRLPQWLVICMALVGAIPARRHLVRRGARALAIP